VIRRLFYSCLVLTFCLLTSRGQLPSGVAAQTGQHGISVDVRVVGSGGGTAMKTASDTDTGKFIGVGGQKLTTTSYDRKTSQNHRISLEITIRNFAVQPDNVQLEWYFFGEPVHTNREFVFDSSTMPMPLQAGQSQTVNATSKDATTSVDQKLVTADGYIPITAARESGTKLKGWLVRVVADGKVIRAVGSDQKYENIGMDDRKLQAMKSAPPVR